jgi:hypothetical protein
VSPGLRSRLASLEQRSGSVLPFFRIVEPDPAETYDARAAEARRAADAYERRNPRGRASLVICDRDEGATP